MLNEKIFLEPQSGKQWRLAHDVVRMETGMLGRAPKIKEISELSDYEKRSEREKAAIAKMRKGFVYIDQDAAPGAPALHVFGGKVFTGFSPIASADNNEFFFARTVGEFDDTIITRMNCQGKVLREYHLESGLCVFKIQYIATCGKLFIDADHNIYELELSSGAVKLLAERSETFKSVLSTKGAFVCYWEKGCLTVHNAVEDMLIWKKPVQFTDAAYCECHLSPDTQWLTYMATPREIGLVNLTSGLETILSTPYECKGPSPEDTLFFMENGQTLVQDMGTQGLMRWTTSDGQEAEPLGKMPQPLYPHMIYNQVDEAAGLWLRRGPMTDGSIASMLEYDPQTLDLRGAIPIDFLVKTCKVSIGDDYLLAYTDWGVISAYKQFRICDKPGK